MHKGRTRVACILSLAVLAGCGKDGPAPPATPTGTAPAATVSSSPPSPAGGTVASPTPTPTPMPGAGAAPTPADLAYSYGWLGARLSTTPPPGVAPLPLQAGQLAVYVKGFEDNSPAQAGGMEFGDAILAFQGKALTTPDAFLGAIRQAHGIVSVGVLRESGSKELSIALGRRPLLPAIEEALRTGAGWLATQQTPSGGWPHAFGNEAGQAAGPEVVMTSFVLGSLTALPPSLRDDARLGLLPALERGVTFLLARQGPDGALGDADEKLTHKNYSTALAAVALATLDRTKYAEPLARMSAYLAKAQLAEDQGFHEFDWPYGGWNYYDAVGPYATRADLSITSYVAEALAGLLPKEHPAWPKLALYLRRVQNWPDENATPTEQDDGGFYFTPRNSKAGSVQVTASKLRFASYGSMTCDGLRTLLALDPSPDSTRALVALNWLKRHYTLDANPGFSDRPLPQEPAGEPRIAFDRGIYFYYLHSLAKALLAVGREKLDTPDGQAHYWAGELALRLIALQRLDRTWKNASNVMNEDDPLLATGLAVRTLAVTQKVIAR
ncbi:MAG: hypothetical protein HYZ53_10555 [Planctomycetes bacterium]|nr:hypothetical protein [Planctomycetota bacterium]